MADRETAETAPGNEAGLEEARVLLERVEEWRGRDIEMTPLVGGQAHRSLVLTLDGERYVLKFLNPEVSELGVPLSQVVANTKLAGEAGVGGEVLYQYDDVPAIILKWVDGTMLEQEDLHGRPDLLERVVASIRKLHSGPAFVGRLDLFGQLEKYRAIAAEAKAPLPDGFDDWRPTVERIRAALQHDPPAPVSCHSDLLAHNIIDAGDRIWLIDYDIAGMAEVCFELGNMAAEADFDPDELANLCELYFGAHDERKLARASLYLAMANYTWSALFALLAGTVEELADEDFDYAAEAADKYRQAERDLGDPRLEDLLAKAR